MTPPGVSIITCTSDRPQAFALCCRWLGRMDYPREAIEWLVVDDGKTPADVPDWMPGVRHVRLSPGKSPRESFRANMIAGLEMATCDRVLFVEDDDWYAGNYVSIMAHAIHAERALVGGAQARYYHVGARCWRIHPNRRHASLSTTGLHRSLIPVALHILQTSNFQRAENPEQLDGTLWKRSGIPARDKFLLPTSEGVVSIKGMPGKRGLGIHHTPGELRGYHADPDLSVLRSWIGEDADAYASFGAAATVADSAGLETRLT